MNITQRANGRRSRRAESTSAKRTRLPQSIPHHDPPSHAKRHLPQYQVNLGQLATGAVIVFGLGFPGLFDWTGHQLLTFLALVHLGGFRFNGADSIGEGGRALAFAFHRRLLAIATAVFDAIRGSTLCVGGCSTSFKLALSTCAMILSD